MVLLIRRRDDELPATLESRKYLYAARMYSDEMKISCPLKATIWILSNVLCILRNLAVIGLACTCQCFAVAAKMVIAV